MKNKIIIHYVSLLVASLNIFDGFVTHYGLKKNEIEEFNPFMDLLWATSPILFLCVKIALSMLILLTSYFVYKKSAEQFQKIFSIILIGTFSMYLGIFGVHLFWLSLL
ncbi:DUF5658 family protein [Solibacillus sp. FSL H8-0538]|uniref:DUF5658 family protein n=1 Tax=Solibacillus sp. FSL H8-0538 TaxID=2921400 RepID=UPI0030FA73C2